MGSYSFLASNSCDGTLLICGTNVSPEFDVCHSTVEIRKSRIDRLAILHASFTCLPIDKMCHRNLFFLVDSVLNTSLIESTTNVPSGTLQSNFTHTALSMMELLLMYMCPLILG